MKEALSSVVRGTIFPATLVLSGNFIWTEFKNFCTFLQSLGIRPNEAADLKTLIKYPYPTQYTCSLYQQSRHHTMHTEVSF